MKNLFTHSRIALYGVIGAVLFASTIIAAGIVEDPVGHREAVVFHIAELSSEELAAVPLAELDQMSKDTAEYAANHHANQVVATEVAARVDSAIRFQIDR